MKAPRFALIALIAGVVLALSQQDVTGRKECKTREEYALAQKHFSEALGELQQANYQKANLLLDRGIRALGTTYDRGTFTDDTDLNLHFGQTEEKAGHLEVAANFKRGVLETRLSVYQDAHECSP